MTLKITNFEGIGGLPPSVRVEATLPDREDTRTIAAEALTERIAIGTLIQNNAEFLGIRVEREQG